MVITSRVAMVIFTRGGQTASKWSVTPMPHFSRSLVAHPITISFSSREVRIIVTADLEGARVDRFDRSPVFCFGVGRTFDKNPSSQSPPLRIILRWRIFAQGSDKCCRREGGNTTTGQMRLYYGCRYSCIFISITVGLPINSRTRGANVATALPDAEGARKMRMSTSVHERELANKSQPPSTFNGMGEL
jgi:hypothetical protein